MDIRDALPGFMMVLFCVEQKVKMRRVKKDVRMLLFACLQSITTAD